ncbi:unnamed protein product, partial [Phaeothamnion confervicola]
ARTDQKWAKEFKKIAMSNEKEESDGHENKQETRKRQLSPRRRTRGRKTRSIADSFLTWSEPLASGIRSLLSLGALPFFCAENTSIALTRYGEPAAIIMLLWVTGWAHGGSVRSLGRAVWRKRAYIAWPI